MKTINKTSTNAQDICLDYCQKLLTEVNTPLIGAEFGVAYGGGVESIGKLWKGRGIIYGFDTFTGHPKQLAVDLQNFEATCMDCWYQIFPNNELSYEYQRAELDRQGLDNVILKKGLINKSSCRGIPYLNYALLDLDILTSMKIGYEAVKNKIVEGGYLFFHDVIPRYHLPLLSDWFLNEVMPSALWEIIYQDESNYLVGVKKHTISKTKKEESELL